MGHPRSSSMRLPEWASSQAQPGKQKKGPADRSGGSSFDLPSGTFSVSGMGMRRTLPRALCGCRAHSPFRDLASSDGASAPFPLLLRIRAGHERETSGKGWRPLRGVGFRGAGGAG